VTVPAEQSATTRLQLVHGTLGASLASVAGSLQLGGTRAASATASACSLVYCEGLAAQRFPVDAASLLSQAKTAVLSVAHAAMAQELPPAAAWFADGAAGEGAEGWRRLELRGVAAVADADALGCGLQAADDVLAMHALLRGSARRRRGESTSSADGGGAAASTGGLRGLGTSSSELDATDVVSLNEQRASGESPGGEAPSAPGGGSGGAGAGAPKPALFVEVRECRVSLPLSADLEASLEVDSAHAELAPARGVRMVHTHAVAVSLKGERPVFEVCLPCA
jgi:hypothetical protein